VLDPQREDGFLNFRRDTASSPWRLSVQQKFRDLLRNRRTAFDK
jgi:hypothetical protein